MASARLKGNIFEPHANYSIYFKLGYYTTHLTFGTDGLSVSTEDQLEKQNWQRNYSMTIPRKFFSEDS